MTVSSDNLIGSFLFYRTPSEDFSKCLGRRGRLERLGE
jgi:hypothetical protein